MSLQIDMSDVLFFQNVYLKKQMSGTAQNLLTFVDLDELVTLSNEEEANELIEKNADMAYDYVAESEKLIQFVNQHPEEALEMLKEVLEREKAIKKHEEHIEHLLNEATPDIAKLGNTRLSRALNELKSHLASGPKETIDTSMKRRRKMRSR